MYSIGNPFGQNGWVINGSLAMWKRINLLLLSMVYRSALSSLSKSLLFAGQLYSLGESVDRMGAQGAIET